MARDHERVRSDNESRITRSQACENGHTDVENIAKVRSDNESQYRPFGINLPSAVGIAIQA